MAKVQKITQEVAIDELADHVSAWQQAKKNAAAWTTTAKALGETVEEAVSEKAGDWVPGTSRTTYGTVNGKRVAYISEYEQETFDKGKATENYPEVIEEFSTKKPMKKFSAS